MPIKTIEDCGKAVLFKIRQSLASVPQDEIVMRAPYHGHHDEYIVGLWLYDIQDFSGSQRSAQVYESIAGTDGVRRSLPPKLTELHYTIYVNEGARFGASQTENAHRIFTRLIDCFYSSPSLGDDDVPLYFSFMRIQEKTALWQSFSRPMQPALYLSAGPLPIDGSRTEVVPLAGKPETSVTRR